MAVGTAASAAGGAAPGATARPGRVTPARERELYAIVLDLVREVGYQAITMDAVAARAGMSKATLYRRWDGKPRLVAQALRGRAPGGPDTADTGSLRGDLDALTRRLAVAGEREGALLAALAHAVRADPELDRALRDTLIAPENDVLAGIVRRAVARGEVAPDCPALPFLPHLLLGALVARRTVDARPVDSAYLAGYVDAVVLPALLHRPGPRPLPEITP